MINWDHYSGLLRTDPSLGMSPWLTPQGNHSLWTRFASLPRRKVTQCALVFLFLFPCTNCSFHICLTVLPRDTNCCPALVWMSLLGERALVSLDDPSPGKMFTLCSFDCPSLENSSSSFIWLNCYARFTEGERMNGTTLNNQSLSRLVYCKSASTLH